MCGITGYLSNGRSGIGAADFRGLIDRMTSSLAHRGPDTDGRWVDIDASIGLGHRRLAIVDLSEAGAQPMVSASGRFVVSVNGEIYNWRPLRKELERLGHCFRGHSDTEVAVSAFDEWGIVESLNRFVGMFAFAIWDRCERTLYLARDRMGEKPLYYGYAGDELVFASELKAFRQHPSWHGHLDRNAIAMQLRYTYIPAPHTIYEDFFKVLPGTVLRISAREGKFEIHQEKFWSVENAVAVGARAPRDIDDGDTEEQLDQLLRQAIADQMVADVPVGAFLSGGIDSSAVVAVMQQMSSTAVHTFSIAFEEEGYNEAEHAARVAAHLGVKHHELTVTSRGARDVIPLLPTLYDEPFSDSSQIPTYLISSLTRGQVTVALTGDGADELFGGYTRYFHSERLWKKLQKYPALMRQVGGQLLCGLPTPVADWMLSRCAPVLPNRFRGPIGGRRVKQLGAVLSASTLDALYRHEVSLFDDPNAIVLGSDAPWVFPVEGAPLPDTIGPFERMMYLDCITYLPDDILVKVDRASMAVGLETRVPFLDHRIVEFAWCIPEHQKIRDGVGKWILRRLLDRYVPRALVDRPKMGFGVPIDQWLRGPLREWGESLVNERRLAEQGIYDPRTVRNLWEAHIRGDADEHYRLWPILMFQAWHDNSSLAIQ